MVGRMEGGRRGWGVGDRRMGYGLPGQWEQMGTQMGV